MLIVHSDGPETVVLYSILLFRPTPILKAHSGEPKTVV